MVKTVKIGGKKKETIGPMAMKIRLILNELGKRGKIQREIVRCYQQRLIENQTRRSDRRRAEKVKKTGLIVN